MGVEPIISCSQNKRIDRSATPKTGMIGFEPILLVLETNALPLNYTLHRLWEAGFEPALTKHEFVVLPIILFPWILVLIFLRNNVIWPFFDQD
jgi:hypothetical protein